MKFQLEKPAVNVSKLTGGKNEKARWGPWHEKMQLGMEIKTTECVIYRQEAF